jgi:hypothetical protein
VKWTRAAQGAGLLAAYGILQLGRFELGGTFGKVLGAVGLVASFFAFWFLQRDPTTASPRETAFIIAAVVFTLVASILPDSPGPLAIVNVTAVLLSVVAVMALPLWLPARWERWIFLASGLAVIGLGGYFLSRPDASIFTLSLMADLVRVQVWMACIGPALAATAVAVRLGRLVGASTAWSSPEGYRPHSVPPTKPKAPKLTSARVLVAKPLAVMSDDEKAARLADLERRFKAGEIPEHIYLDKLQELES